MSAASLAQYAAFLLIVGLLVRPVGGYLARVFSGERTFAEFRSSSGSADGSVSGPPDP